MESQPPTEAAQAYLDDEKKQKLGSVDEYWGDKMERKAAKRRVTIGLVTMLFIILFNSVMLMRLEQNLSAKILDNNVNIRHVQAGVRNLTKDFKKQNNFEYFFVKKQVNHKTPAKFDQPQNPDKIF